MRHVSLRGSEGLLSVVEGPGRGKLCKHERPLAAALQVDALVPCTSLRNVSKCDEQPLHASYSENVLLSAKRSLAQPGSLCA